MLARPALALARRLMAPSTCPRAHKTSSRRVIVILNTFMDRLYSTRTPVELEEAFETSIRVYNSLTGQKVPPDLHWRHFVFSSCRLCRDGAQEPLRVRSRTRGLTWYTCGPTVYDHAHVGHARTYVQIDILVRIIERFFGVPVEHVLGMTNIDDKIIARARETNVEPAQLAYKFECDFFDDMRTYDGLVSGRVASLMC